MDEAERRRVEAEAEAEAFAAVYRQWLKVDGPVEGRVVICSMAHDDGCPAGNGCICEPTMQRYLMPIDFSMVAWNERPRSGLPGRPDGRSAPRK